MTPEELARLDALLRVPSISAVAEHAPDMARAAELVAREIRLAGGQAEIRLSTGHPLVVGEVAPGDDAPDAPKVILYGHYDVQPPGPEELWTTPPFEPTLRDGDLYARGASDDKGNLFMLLVAVQRLAAEGRLPVRVQFVIEGEEESGGTTALDHFTADDEPALAAIIFDSPMAAPGRPTICSGVRGMAYRRIRVRTAASDAHSGIYGGAALNAVHALMAILAAVTPHEGRLPEALYAGVAPAGAAEVSTWAGLPGGGEVLADAGLRPSDAGAAEGFYMRTLASPSVDVHGVAAGEPGAVKTNVPCEATATLSMRLAPGQDARLMSELLDELIRAAAPAGAEVEIEHHGLALPAALDPEHPVLVAAADGMEAGTGWRPAPVRVGGTIPVVAVIAAKGIPVILTGFGLPDDGIHGPDEHLRHEYLEIGTQAAMGMLVSLGRLGTQTA